MSQQTIENVEKECKLCSKPTKSVVNIDFSAIPICDACCSTIMVQQAKYLADNFTKHEND